MNRSFCHIVAVAVATALCPLVAHAQTPVATYLFGNTLGAEQALTPMLVSVDPLGESRFESADVFGQMRTVYRLAGQARPSSQQAGLTLNTSALIAPDKYSVEMVFEFVNTQSTNRWKSIINASNRKDDNALFLDDANHFDVWTRSRNPGSFSLPLNTFVHLTLTNDSNVARVYANGLLDKTVNTNVLNLSTASNPNRLLSFFLDSDPDALNGEYGDARIALIRLYDSALNANQIATLAGNALPNQTAAPEPGTWSLAILGIFFFGVWVRRHSVRETSN